MKAWEWKKGPIQRKDFVREDYQTDSRDGVAEYIQTEVIDADRWPMELGDIAHELGCSRQHVKDTLEYYFERADLAVSSGPLDIEIPEDVDRESYLRGYIMGLKDAN